MLRRFIFGSGISMLLPAGAALAANLAPESKIDITWRYVYAPSSMPTDGGQDFMTGEATVIPIGNFSGRLRDHTSGRCMLAAPNDPKSGAFKLTGRCTYKDGDGDMIFPSDEESGSSMSDPAHAERASSSGVPERTSGSPAATTTPTSSWSK
jgi:hypothetical protein